MPAEFEPQDCIWMLWPRRPDNWRDGAKPAQHAYKEVAQAIAQFEPVTVGVNHEDYANGKAVYKQDENVTVIEMTTDDAWCRDCGPTFVDQRQGRRARRATGSSTPGAAWWTACYFPWANDDARRPEGLRDRAASTRYRIPRASCWRAAPSTWTARAPC